MPAGFRARFDRRWGSRKSLSDAMASFSKSIDDNPRAGVPKRGVEGHILSSRNVKPGETLLSKTATGETRRCRMSEDFQYGESCKVLNDGTGTTIVSTPPAMTFEDGSTSYTMSSNYQKCEVVRIDNRRFMVLRYVV